jgi:hypothetical protein
MKRLLSILITLAILFTLTAGEFTSSAQKGGKDTSDPFATPRMKQPGFKDKIPPGLQRGASPEAKEAWEKLTPEQRAEVKARVDKSIEEAKARHDREKEEKRAQKVERKNWKDILKGKDAESIPESPLYFTDKHGDGGKVIKGKDREPVINTQSCYDCDVYVDPCYDCYPDPNPTPTPEPTPYPTPTPEPTGGGDADADGLPESFENAVADSFTPFYHVSAYETDNFATFVNSPTQTVAQRLGPNPFSYFRVQPLGFAYNYWGQLVSVLRIDYLSLWDHDSGLVTGGNCAAFPGLTGMAGILAHEFDNERSAVLVAAPVYSYSYNLNPSSYSAYSYYTAAHEFAPNDKSMYADFPTNPVPAGWHIHLALALSKHSTYTFNPDYLPLAPDYAIAAALASVDYYCYRSAFDYSFGWNDIACLAAQYYAYGALFECAVERFIDQGGRYADTRINVGDPTNPINGATFIQDNSHGLRDKFDIPIF